jgi:lysophospholipase L1-like esterase
MLKKLLLLGALAAATAAGPVILAALPIARLDLPWWKHRFEDKQARLHAGHVGLIFYGDSITQNWEKAGPQPWENFRPVWDRFYGDRDAVNLGFSGDTTANLLWRVEHGEADGIAPKLAVVLIGANNLGRLHWSTAQTLAGIDAIVSALRRRLPHSKILLLSVLVSDRSPWASQTTEEINRALPHRYDTDPAVTFLDVNHVLLNDGKVDRSQFYDPLLTPPEAPLHPSAMAQARIAATMEPTLAALLGDRNHLKSP